MTPEEYLRARGWWQYNDIDNWTEWYWGDESADGTDRSLAEAVAIQVRRDHDCAEFVRAYGGALAAAEFDEGS